LSQPCPRLGLIVSVTRHASATERDADALRDDLSTALEANGLSLRGAARGAREFVVVRDGGQATDADRQLLMQWSARWARIAAISVSPPIDLEDEQE